MNDSNTSLPSLEQFPKIPVAGLITVAESHSELHAIQSTLDNPASGKGFWPLVVKYGAVDGHRLTSRLPFKIPSIKTSTHRASLILESRQAIPKALWDSWWEEGIKGVYNCLVKAERSNDLSDATKVVIKGAVGVTSFCVKLYETPSNFFTFLFPHLQWKVEDVNEEFSQVRRWKDSWIRAMAWHPTAPHLALALNDDSVRCCLVGNDVFPMLRCNEQKNVTCVSWRAHLNTELAVGCEDCIIIWHLRSPVTLKAGKDKSTVLKAAGHGPVSCVEYSRDGIYLMSSSSKDSAVYIWDAFTYDRTPLKRIGGGGIPLALWAPTGNRLLAASPSKAFWVWKNGEYWQCKRWTTKTCMVEAACWNPSGTILLFATGGFIFGLFYELSPVDLFVSQTDSIIKPVYNIEECHVLDTEENLAYKVGGKVRQMEWDERGHRVAIMFDDSDVIALFRVVPTARSGSDLLAPLGFIRGHPDESPSAIAFQKEFSDGALLTIAWNSGRIQHFPMIFALPQGNRNMMHEDYYRTQHVVHGRSSLFTAAGFVSPRLSVPGSMSHLSSQNVSELINQYEDPTSPSRLFSVSNN